MAVYRTDGRELSIHIISTLCLMHVLQAFILPDESIDVTFTIHVRKENAHVLNLKQERFTSTIILHTLLGKDHFVAIWGDYRTHLLIQCAHADLLILALDRTCFGTSFEALARLKKPIRELDSEADLVAPDRAMHAPKEISSLVNWLLDNQIEKVVSTETASERSG